MEKIMILDTETTNDIDCPIMYDCSFIVADFNGNVYDEKAYVVADVFLDKELMASAYYIDKMPQYWNDIKNGTRELKTLFNIKKAVAEVMKKYNITKVFAYNCRFDYLSTALTQRYITKSKFRWFFPYGTEFYDILKMARNHFKYNEMYSAFCVDNAYITKNGKPQMTAEVVYRFLKDETFVEEHKGLEDCKIEYEILLHCFKYLVRGESIEDFVLFNNDKRITQEMLDKMPKTKG